MKTINPIKCLASLALIFPLSAFAHIIAVDATIPFPTTVPASSIRYATYTVTNLSSGAVVTAMDQSQLPAGLSISASTCGTPLNPGGTCTIQLKLAAPGTPQTIVTALREWAKPTPDGLVFPITITIGKAVNNAYAYISNNQAASPAQPGTPPSPAVPAVTNLSQCLIDSANGRLEDCTIAFSLDSPANITTLNNNLYIGSADPGTPLRVCNIDPFTGSVSNCTGTGNGFDTPFGVTFNSTGTLAYVANNGSDTISLCTVDAGSGALGNCTNTGNGFSAPSAITLNPQGNFAYITNSTTNTVSVCSVNLRTGTLSTCGTTGYGFSNPWGIVMNATGTVAHITNKNNTVSVCAANPNSGALGSCVTTGANFAIPASPTINSTGRLAYIPNFSSNSVSLCSVDGGSGLLSNCTNTGSGFTAPNGIGLY